MFSINELKSMGISATQQNDKLGDQQTKTGKYKNKTPPNIYSNTYNTPFVESKNDNEINTQMIDRILETEKQYNKTEMWNKLNKTIKLQKLYTFSEKYKKEYGLSSKDTNNMKIFFNDCLDKNKLQKTKDLIYDKEKQEIISIPSLIYNVENHKFTLKNIDKQRVSTLKSLTPKKGTEKKILDIQDIQSSSTQDI